MWSKYEMKNIPSQLKCIDFLHQCQHVNYSIKANSDVQEFKQFTNYDIQQGEF